MTLQVAETGLLTDISFYITTFRDGQDTGTDGDYRCG